LKRKFSCVDSFLAGRCACYNAAGLSGIQQSHLRNIQIMARADAKTAVLADGLRYKSKVSGSPFAATTSFGAATMSCFMCGKHRARSMMGTRKVLGKSQAVCAPSCKALDEALANAAT
jgi:hypothetical protein